MELDQDSDLDTPSGRRTWYIVVLGVIAISALALGVGAWSSRDDEQNFPYDDDLAGIDEPAGYAAPDDGLDSIGLPVTLTPATGLVDGQQVQISGSGFPVNSQVGLIQCTSQSITLGQSACDMSTLSYATVAADGTVAATFMVRRHLYVGGTPVDCGAGNVDPATWVSAQKAAEGQFTCIVGVGSISNYDVSGNSAIAFDGAVFGGPPPSLPDITTTTTNPYPTSYPSIRNCSEPPVDAYDDVCIGTGSDYSTDTTMWTGGDDELQGIIPTTSIPAGNG